MVKTVTQLTLPWAPRYCLKGAVWEILERRKQVPDSLPPGQTPPWTCLRTASGFGDSIGPSCEVRGRDMAELLAHQIKNELVRFSVKGTEQ